MFENPFRDTRLSSGTPAGLGLRDDQWRRPVKLRSIGRFEQDDFRRRYTFALIPVVSDFVAQRSNGYSQEICGAGPVPPMISQCLKDELALNASECVPNQMLDTCAVDCGEPE